MPKVLQLSQMVGNCGSVHNKSSCQRESATSNICRIIGVVYGDSLALQSLREWARSQIVPFYYGAFSLKITGQGTHANTTNTNKIYVAIELIFVHRIGALLVAIGR